MTSSGGLSIDSGPVVRDLHHTGPATAVIIPALSCNSSVLLNLKAIVDTKRRILVADSWFQHEAYIPACTPVPPKEAIVRARNRQNLLCKPEVSWADRINEVVSIDGVQLLNNLSREWRLDSLTLDSWRMLYLAREMFAADMEEIEKGLDTLYEMLGIWSEEGMDCTRCAKEIENFKSLEQFFCDLVQLRMTEFFGDVEGNISWSLFANTVANRPLNIVSGRAIDSTALIDDILLDRRRTSGTA